MTQYAPCIGCGYCCKKTPCILGVKLFGMVKPCAGLVFKDGRYWCKPVLEAKGADQKRLTENLYIGAGCCSPMNSDRLSPPSSCSLSQEP